MNLCLCLVCGMVIMAANGFGCSWPTLDGFCANVFAQSVWEEVELDEYGRTWHTYTLLLSKLSFKHACMSVCVTVCVYGGEGVDLWLLVGTAKTNFISL